MTDLKPIFTTTPDTHEASHGRWDKVRVRADYKGIGSPSSDEEPLPWLLLQFQNGPIEEHGVNGVQLPDVLRVCLARYRMLNEAFPCRENAIVITKLQEAIMWDEERTAQRTAKGVEGFYKPRTS